MKPEEQRIAIAKACGWHNFIINDEYGNDRALKPEQAFKMNCRFYDLPDYLNDLNAMHEAEKILSYEQNWNYCLSLRVLTSDNEHRATATQRAEAFLKTLNLWKP